MTFRLLAGSIAHFAADWETKARGPAQDEDERVSVLHRTAFTARPGAIRKSNTAHTIGVHWAPIEIEPN